MHEQDYVGAHGWCVRNHMGMDITRTMARTPVATPLGRASGAQLGDDLRLGAVRLRVRDAIRSVDFYERVLGLRAERSGDDFVVRDADGTPLVELEVDPDARPAARTAGLYHLALLYPSREELARVVERIAAMQAPVQGASDHGTHEAIYLPDPDGNGLELAVDRDREHWPNLADVEAIAPRPLDLRSLLATIAEDDVVASHAGAGVRVGHLHLHVGDIEQAAAFYVDALGFELVTIIDSAAFVSAGGYHHHLAVNTWRGEGVPAQPAGHVGLVWWSIELSSVQELDEAQARLEVASHAVDRPAPDLLVVRDPSGLELHLRARS